LVAALAAIVAGAVALSAPAEELGQLALSWRGVVTGAFYSVVGSLLLIFRDIQWPELPQDPFGHDRFRYRREHDSQLPPLPRRRDG